jgi:hypothetical protein
VRRPDGLLLIARGEQLKAELADVHQHPEPRFATRPFDLAEETAVDKRRDGIENGGGQG